MPDAHLAPAELEFIVEHAGFDDVALRARVEQLATVAHSQIRAFATQALKSTQADYLKGLQLPRVERVGEHRWRAVIELKGALANQLEQGVGPYDMRTTLLREGTHKLRYSKDGHRYRFVPFRHAAPDGRAHAGTPMGAQFTKAGLGEMSRAFRGQLDERAARTLGRAIHREARQLSPTQSAPTETGTRRVKYGDGLDSGLAPILRGRHHTDVFAGMYRETKVYERAEHAQFTSFRTISTNPKSFREDSDGGAPEQNWTHPGITARRLFAKAHQHLVQWADSGAW